MTPELPSAGDDSLNEVRLSENMPKSEGNNEVCVILANLSTKLLNGFTDRLFKSSRDSSPLHLRQGRDYPLRFHLDMLNPS